MGFQVYSVREACRTIAEDFRRRYQTATGNWRGDGRNGTLYERLLALGSDPEPRAVARLLSAGAVMKQCYACGKYHPAGVLQIRRHQSWHRDGYTVDLCPTCICAALSMLQAHGLLPKESPDA